MKKTSGEDAGAPDVAELVRSRAVLFQILNSVTESIFWKDRDSVYLGCNFAFARAAGLDSSELIVGMTDLQLPWRDYAAAYVADDREVIENNRPKRHIIEAVQQADGTTLWVDTTKVPLIDEAGRTTEWRSNALRRYQRGALGEPGSRHACAGPTPRTTTTSRA